MGFYLTMSTKYEIIFQIKERNNIMNFTNDLKNGTDELIENQTEVIEALQKADHFYIVHYCKKRDNIEERRCFWDSKSRVWQTKGGKLAITCVALNEETHEIDGYRTFTDIFSIEGRRAKHRSSEVH